MSKRKNKKQKDKRLSTILLDVKQKIELHEAHKKSRVISCAPEELAVLLGIGQHANYFQAGVIYCVFPII
jgi:copper(I)-binding protein